MINANELRIGSKFIGVGMLQTVDSIEPYSEHKGYEYLIRVKENRNQYKPVDMEPITLTHEILDKCGFDISYRLVVGKFDFSWYLKPGCVSVFHSGCPLNIEAFTLHQLQNLYFALTGEELQYTPSPTP